MPSHYTAPEMFLFTDTKFEQEYTEYQYEAAEKHLMSMVVDGGRAFSVQPSNQWVWAGAQSWVGLDLKGEL